MPNEILFQSADLGVFVLDIPASLKNSSDGGRIYSAAPLETPYVTPEPKGKKREAFLAKIPQEQLDYDEEVAASIKKALQIASNGLGDRPWCLPRTIRQDLVDGLSPADHNGSLYPCTPIVLAPGNNCFRDVHNIQYEVVVNKGDTAAVTIDDGTSFIIPPSSTFIWTGIARALHVLTMYKTLTMHPLNFDLIVMDPPWTNRSVRNAAYYFTKEDQHSDPFEDAMKMVEKFHSTKGYVMIWITNKAAVRQQAVAALQGQHFQLVEEWIWVKVTTKGEPVTPLDGLWRKPYERLLVFQHRVDATEVKRRQIFAVPDLHSRKPNLKSLCKLVLGSGCGLELFARNLTAGWWSIGDEVLKYQDTRQ